MLSVVQGNLDLAWTLMLVEWMASRFGDDACRKTVTGLSRG